jgi:hypothetical protein
LAAVLTNLIRDGTSVKQTARDQTVPSRTAAQLSEHLPGGLRRPRPQLRQRTALAGEDELDDPLALTVGEPLQPQAAQAPRVVGANDPREQVDQVVFVIELEAQAQTIARFQRVGARDQDAAGADVAGEAVEPADLEPVGDQRHGPHEVDPDLVAALRRSWRSQWDDGLQEVQKVFADAAVRAGHGEEAAVDATLAGQRDDRGLAPVQEAQRDVGGRGQRKLGSPGDGAHDGCFKSCDTRDEHTDAFLLAPVQPDHLPTCVGRSRPILRSERAGGRRAIARLAAGYNAGMAKTQRERDAAAREAKLERIKDQVATGDLTVRKMSDEERAKWAKHREETEVSASPADRRRAAAAQRRRQRRAARTP